MQREYLEAAYDEMRQRFGSLEGYFTDGLKIDAATRERLRAANILVGGNFYPPIVGYRLCARLLPEGFS